MSRLYAAVLFALSLALPACGGTLEPDVTRATLALEGPPGAVHAGIYVAVAREFDRGEGVDLTIRPRRAAARADIRLLDIDEAARSTDLRCFAALVQTPLLAVLTERGGRPKRVAIGAGDADRATLRTAAPDATPVAERDPLAALDRGRATAAVGRIDDLRAGGLRELRVEDRGAPDFPQLVLCATPETARDEPQVLRGTVAALRRGYDETVRDPDLAVSTLLRFTRLGERDRARVTAALDRVTPSFTSGAGFGAFDERSLRAYERWVRGGA